jgi:hypothetical protein
MSGRTRTKRDAPEVPTQNPTFGVEVNKTGSYVIVMQVHSNERPKTTSYRIIINAKDIQTVDVLYSDNWSSILVPVELQSEKNTLAFLNIGDTMGEILSIDLFPQTS